jgi:hypothetical protein
MPCYTTPFFLHRFQNLIDTYVRDDTSVRTMPRSFISLNKIESSEPPSKRSSFSLLRSDDTIHSIGNMEYRNQGRLAEKALRGNKLAILEKELEGNHEL